ncbi:MAG TPA: hypothetical protein VFI31_29915 [Pirellulales bacterium]|nr:hypothetical protein [Pirellulales bacterium]
MSTVHHTVAVGIFDKVRMAQQAVEELREAGFIEKQIGLIARKVEVTQIASEPSDDEKRTADGALGGILTGAGLGGLWAIGIEVELLPAIGELVLGGIFSGLFAGAIAGAAAGGIIGTLVAAGLPREHAKEYEQQVRAGRVIITVRTDDRYDEALAILRANGGEVSAGDPLI